MVNGQWMVGHRWRKRILPYFHAPTDEFVDCGKGAKFEFFFRAILRSSAHLNHLSTRVALFSSFHCK
jgi:hypothetical protein